MLHSPAIVGSTRWVVSAVAVVVSEERGTISLIVEGGIEIGLDAIKLRAKLEKLLEPKKKESRWFRHGKKA